MMLSTILLILAVWVLGSIPLGIVIGRLLKHSNEMPAYTPETRTVRARRPVLNISDAA